jgi:hypothetical protein
VTREGSLKKRDFGDNVVTHIAKDDWNGEFSRKYTNLTATAFGSGLRNYMTYIAHGDQIQISNQKVWCKILPA